MSRSVGKNMASGGMLSLARLLTGVVRVKIVALALGASGVGIYSVLLQLYLTALPVVSMGLAIPIINLGRRHVVSGDYAEAGSIAGTALAIIIFNGLVVSVAALVFGNALFGELGVSGAADGLVWPVLLATLFAAISSSFWEGLSYLCDRFDAYVRVGIVTAIGEMAFVASAAWFYGLRGAIVAMPIGPTLMFVTYWLALRRDSNARKVLGNLSFRKAHLPALFAYSAMMFGAGAMTNVALTYLRSRVLIEAGAAANGYLQVATSVSAYILSFVSTGFYGHLHARAAAAGDTTEVRAELHKALRLGLLIAFSGCATAVVLADFLIPLLYSGEFRPAAQVVTAYMPGELCYQLLIMLMGYQLTVSHRRRFTSLNVGYGALIFAAGVGAIPLFGVFGYVGAHIGAAFATVAIALFISWRSGQIRSSFLVMAIGLLGLLAAMSAVFVLLRDRGPVGYLALPGLIPAAITGAFAASQLFGWPRRGLDSEAAR
jgi:PST family polysaccharide transporter